MAKTRGPTCGLGAVAAVIWVGLGLLGLTPQALAVAYTFTPIAVSPADGYPTTGSINRDGTVAYVLTHDNGLKQVVKTDMNGVTTVVADNSGPLDDFRFSYNVNSTPVIDDSGTVAFGAWRDSGGRGIYAGSGGSIRTVAETSGSVASVSRPYINGLGQIAYAMGLETGGSQLIVDDHGTEKLVADTTGPFSSVGADGIDNGGRVFFVAVLAGGEQKGFFISDGNSLVEVARTAWDQFYTSSVSTYQAVFTTSLAGGGQGLYAYRDGTLFKVLDGTDGFQGFTACATNDRGEIIFLGGKEALGIYSAADPSSPVLEVGAPFLGSTVNNIEMFPSLNNAGQFTFLAKLADYRSVLVRADPVPEPTCMGLLIAGVLMANRRRLRR